MAKEYGDTWVYEGIVGGLPGIELSNTHAVAIQFGLFQVGILVFAAIYDLWSAALAGTAAVIVAAVGSVAMHRLGTQNRALDAPGAYYRLLFGSSIEVVLSVLAFIALVTHLFVFDVQSASEPLITGLFGSEPPVIVVYLVLLVCWDLCYRIGTSWWVAVVSLWRALTIPSEAPTARRFARLDAENVGFALVQLLLVPFLRDQPILLLAVTGHVAAVTVVSAASIWLTRSRAAPLLATTSD
jgi:hypothetical protein